MTPEQITEQTDAEKDRAFFARLAAQIERITQQVIQTSEQDNEDE